MLQQSYRVTAANRILFSSCASQGAAHTENIWVMLCLHPRQQLDLWLVCCACLPTETKDTPDAPAAAKKELEKLGPMSRLVCGS